MAPHIVELHDAPEALDRARAFLIAEPAHHNLLLTILESSIEFSLGGSFWLVLDGTEVVGFGLESPPGMGAVLAPMPASISRRLAETITVPLPRVQGEASTVAAFAGAWTQRYCVGAEPEGGRFYELGEVRAVADAPGRLRLAEPADRPTLVAWTIAFGGETETIAAYAEQVVDLAVAREQMWVWDDGGPVSMSGASNAVAGIARIQRVYTPPEHRGRGYATACVEQQSRLLAERGLGCVLYTQLSNPTSNGIYQRIGYRPIAETLVYRFTQ
jgi:ribosomal protein S18 acetylase RimI-like enzyme